MSNYVPVQIFISFKIEFRSFHLEHTDQFWYKDFENDQKITWPLVCR